MPLVNVRFIEGVLSAEQKKAVIKGVTDAVVAVTGENLREFLVVLIDEVKSGDWAVGGRPLTTDDVKAIVARLVKRE